MDKAEAQYLSLQTTPLDPKMHSNEFQMSKGSRYPHCQNFSPVRSLADKKSQKEKRKFDYRKTQILHGRLHLQQLSYATKSSPKNVSDYPQHLMIQSQTVSSLDLFAMLSEVISVLSNCVQQMRLE